MSKFAVGQRVVVKRGALAGLVGTIEHVEPARGPSEHDSALVEADYTILADCGSVRSQHYESELSEVRR